LRTFGKVLRKAKRIGHIEKSFPTVSKLVNIDDAKLYSQYYTTLNIFFANSYLKPCADVIVSARRACQNVGGGAAQRWREKFFSKVPEN